MLHVWLIPVLIVLLLLVGGLYLMVRNQGGSGVRAGGRTLVDEPTDDEDRPPD